jgi:hypothetical protein
LVYVNGYWEVPVDLCNLKYAVPAQLILYVIVKLTTIERIEHWSIEPVHIILADKFLDGMPITSPNVDVCVALENVLLQVIGRVHFFCADPASVFSIIV